MLAEVYREIMSESNNSLLHKYSECATGWRIDHHMDRALDYEQVVNQTAIAQDRLYVSKKIYKGYAEKTWGNSNPWGHIL